MAKVKARSNKKFVGYRRNRNLATKLRKVVEKNNEIPSGPGNNELQTVSASTTKLNLFGIDLDAEVNKETSHTGNEDDCYFFVQKSGLQTFFSSVMCPECENKTLTLNLETANFSGFAVKGILSCSVCLKKNLLQTDFLLK